MKKEITVLLCATIIGVLTAYFVSKYQLGLQFQGDYFTYDFLIQIGLIIAFFLFFTFLSWQLLTRFENRGRNYALICFSIIVSKPVLFQSYYLKMAIDKKLELYISESDGFSEEKLYSDLDLLFRVSIAEIILLLIIISYSIFKLIRVKSYSPK
jgi:hypothetical protein